MDFQYLINSLTNSFAMSNTGIRGGQDLKKASYHSELQNIAVYLCLDHQEKYLTLF